MALRIRKNGRIFCAALTEPLPGDTYVCDQLHYVMSAEHRAIVTEPAERHEKRGEWWWRNAVPPEIVIENREPAPKCCAPVKPREDT